MQANNKEYRTVVLAGLLHDIGKLLQRGSFGELDIKGKHPAVSARFVGAFSDCFNLVSNVDLLKLLVQKHHESNHFEAELNINSISNTHEKTLASLISLADNLSSAERGEHTRDYQDYKETPLASVLECVNNTGLLTPTVRFHANPLFTPEKLWPIFPDKFQVYEKNELTNLIKTFGEEFYKLFKTGQYVVDRSNFDCIITHLYSLLLKYSWCLPADTQETFPNVSLFDHLRTTSAIASCLYLYHSDAGTLNETAVRDKDAERFLLVSGDISGIQNYIFDIANIGAGGVARRLRARSLYVQLCSEVASHLILNKLELPVMIHTLINSGGHFYLLLPNIVGVRQSLTESQKEMDEWFLKELNGELVLNLAAIPFGDDGFKTKKDDELKTGESRGAGFGEVIKSVNELLDKKKKNRFVSVLQNGTGWQDSSFELQPGYKGEGSCQSCRKFLQYKDGLCSHCHVDLELGKNLPEAQYIAFFHDKKSGEIPIFDYSVTVTPGKVIGVPYLITRINDTDLSDVTTHPAVFRYIAKTVPEKDECEICEKEDSKIATFECIAHRAHGDSLLGFLKMDVDNLGETFIFGLKPKDSISRISTFSRMLDLYFAGYVENIAVTNSDIYTIFSGGDDLFLVGPWDLILETAEHIRRDFHRFTNNQNLTISAGVVINSHHYPIATAADEVEKALKASKLKEGKDSITVLGHPLTWDEWEKVSAEWANLKEIASDEKANNKKVPAVFLYNLLRFGRMWEKYRKKNDVSGLRYHPLLSYSLARNIKQGELPELCEWINKKLLGFPPDTEQQFILDNLILLVNLLILSKRGGK